MEPVAGAASSASTRAHGYLRRTSTARADGAERSRRRAVPATWSSEAKKRQECRERVHLAQRALHLAGAAGECRRGRSVRPLPSMKSPARRSASSAWQRDRPAGCRMDGGYLADGAGETRLRLVVSIQPTCRTTESDLLEMVRLCRALCRPRRLSAVPRALAARPVVEPAVLLGTRRQRSDRPRPRREPGSRSDIAFAGEHRHLGLGAHAGGLLKWFDYLWGVAGPLQPEIAASMLTGHSGRCGSSTSLAGVPDPLLRAAPGQRGAAQVSVDEDR